MAKRDATPVCDRGGRSEKETHKGLAPDLNSAHRSERDKDRIRVWFNRQKMRKDIYKY